MVDSAFDKLNVVGSQSYIRSLSPIFRSTPSATDNTSLYQQQDRSIQGHAYGLRDEDYLHLKILTCTLPRL